MTAVLGFRCDDGVLLAADSQRTGTEFKFSASKIVKLTSHEWLKGVLSGSGPSWWKKLAKNVIDDALSEELQLKDARPKIKSALRSERFVSNKRAKDKTGRLLMGLWLRGQGCRLLEAELPTGGVWEAEERIVFAGTGKSVAELIARALHSDECIHCEEAALIAVCAIKAATEYARNAGGSIDVVKVALDGKIEVASKLAVEQAADFFTDFHQFVQKVFSHLVIEGRWVPTVMPDQFVGELRDSIETFVRARRAVPFFKLRS